MIRIRKGAEPDEFFAWKQKLGQPGYECNWESLRSPEKDILRRSLLMEQGSICCYCEQRLEDDQTTHIEHLRPRHDHHQYIFDYDNLVAECGGNSSVRPVSIHCGQAKGDWYDDILFVSPLNPDCEKHFLFTLDGQILPTEDPSRRKAAAETIRRLNLNDDRLIRMRSAALDYIVSEMDSFTGNEISVQIVQYGERDRRGKFTPFCSAIVSVLRQYQ